MSSKKEGEEPKPIVAKSTYDLQRIKLEKLMKNPDKLVPIPERPKDRSMPHAPDFVRNVMGSSAGAGSGEFHVYRHLRRKEYARQKFIKEKGRRETLEDEYHNKIEQNKRAAEEKTAKKRAKRLKRKQKQKGKKPRSAAGDKSSSSSEESSDNEGEEEGGSKDQGESAQDSEPPPSASGDISGAPAPADTTSQSADSDVSGVVTPASGDIKAPRSPLGTKPDSE